MEKFERNDNEDASGWSFDKLKITVTKRRPRKGASAPTWRARWRGTATDLSRTLRSRRLKAYLFGLAWLTVAIGFAAMLRTFHDPFAAVQECQKQLVESEQSINEVLADFREAVPDFRTDAYTYVAYTDPNLVEDLDERLRDAQWLIDHRSAFEQAMARYIGDHTKAHVRLLAVARDAQELADSPQHPDFDDKYQAQVQQALDWAAYYKAEAERLDKEMASFEEDFKFVQASVLFMTRAKAFASIRPTLSEDGEKVREYLQNLHRYMEQFRGTMQRFRSFVPTDEESTDAFTA